MRNGIRHELKRCLAAGVSFDEFGSKDSLSLIWTVGVPCRCLLSLAYVALFLERLGRDPELGLSGAGFAKLPLFRRRSAESAPRQPLLD